MKNLLIRFLLIPFLLSAGSILSQDFWQPINGPFGGTIIKVIASPGGILYAISSAGVFKSTNEGSQWTQVTPPSINNLKTGGVAPNGYIYLATGNFTSKIYRSTNEGASWEERLPDGGYEFNDMTVTPGGTILAGTFYMFSFHGNFVQSGDIYRSTNNGAAFSLVNFPDLAIISIKANINGDIYVATLNGLWKSVDGGASWGLARNDTCSSVFTSTNGHVFFLSRQNVFRTTNNGSSWQQVAGRMPMASSQDGFLYSAEGGKIFRSADFGSSWNEIAVISNAPLFDVYSILNFGNNRLFTGTDLGVYKSVNGGFAWIESSVGIRLSDIKTIASTNSIIFAGSERYISRSTNNGTNWTNLSEGLPESGAKKLKITPNGVVIAFMYFNGIYRSLNNGDSWTRITALPSDANSGYIAVNSNSNIFIAGNDSLYRSTDNGASWSIVNNGLPADQPSFTGISADSQNNLYVSVSWGTLSFLKGLFKSTDNGASWNQINSQNINADFKFTSGGNIYSITATRLMRSTNGGLSFDFVPTAEEYCIELEIGSLDQIFLHYVDNEIYGIKRSADNAASWTNFTQGLGQLFVYDFDFDNNSFLFAATQSGLFKTINSTLGLITKNTETPVEYKLAQNYPNPFNPVTTIRFDIPEQSFTKLVIYDLQGKEIKTLVHMHLQAGSYTAQLNAEDLSSGIYFYRIETGKFIDVKKMILVK